MCWCDSMWLVVYYCSLQWNKSTRFSTLAIFHETESKRREENTGDGAKEDLITEIKQTN